jgi:hypothetical protein
MGIAVRRLRGRPRGSGVGRSDEAAQAMVRRPETVGTRLAGSAGGGLGGVGEFAQVVAERVEHELALGSGKPA